MNVARADAQKRVVIPDAEPGDIFDIQQEDEGRYVLVRVHRPPPKPRMTRQECLDAIARSPLTPTMSWEELRSMTREP